jgi:hypothetical protein
MKKYLLLLLTLTMGINSLAQTKPLGMDDVDDGQVISVTGWLNVMPPLTAAPPEEINLNVKLMAISGGCTSEDSFEVSMEKLSESTLLVKAVRTKPDFCEAVSRLVIIKRPLKISTQLLQEIDQKKIQILTSPMVSVGIAH